MPDPEERLRERELERRRENELKDLEVEERHEERPLEGLSSSPTTWTQEQDESQADAVHGHDEERSEKASRDQIPPAPPDRTLPQE